MKTLLNLLPEEKKDLVQSRLRSRFLLWQLFLLFLLEVFYFLALVSMYLILNFQLGSLQTLTENADFSSQGEEKRLNTYEEKFQEMNKKVDLVGSVDRSHVYFSQVFRLLDALTPNGIVVDHLSTKDYTVSLFGRADKREDLLLFDERLKGAPECVTDVNIPLSNLFSQEKIDFQVDFTITPTCLKQDPL
jgi:hypothetical protein